MTFLEFPVFLCGHRKAGTTMLLALLDSHPQLLVYPPDSGFFYGWYPAYASTDFSPDEKIRRMEDVVLGNLDYELARLTATDRAETGICIDLLKTKFRDLAAQSDLTPKSMLTSLIQAYRGQFRGSMNATRWVEKTTSTEIYASEVKSWFPNARFVHIIRDPRDNWASLRSGWEKRYRQFNDSYTRLLQSMIDRGRLGLEFARLNQASFGSEDYLVIRYEDLTAAPVAELRKICSFLSIDYDPTLLQPTVCGKFWEGNNFEGKVFRGPSNENVGRWRERIPETEAQLIEFHFKDVMDHFGYEQAFSLMQHANAAAHHYKWFNSTQRHKEESA